MAPLGEQEVHDIEILTLGLSVAPLRRKKVDMRIAAEPAPGVHIAPAFEPQRQLLLTRRDYDPRAYRLGFQTAGHPHHYLAPAQPALARASNLGGAEGPRPDAAPDIHMPGTPIRIGPA